MNEQTPFLIIGAAITAASAGDTIVTSARFSLNTSPQDAITSIYGRASGVTNATSDLTYRLVTGNTSRESSQTKTITYTLGDE